MLKRGFILSLLAIGNFAFGQQASDMYKQGLQMMAERHYRKAVNIFGPLLQQDSSNVNYLAYTAFLYAKVWHDSSAKKKVKPPYYQEARYLSQKAIKRDSNNAEAHYALAFTIGIINEDASTKEQIANAGIMKKEIDKCLALNPQHAGAYHLLGRWYRRLAELNGFERFAMKTIYGSSLPEAKLDDAAKAFEKAYQYEPDYILHQYELAYTYHEMNKDPDARIWLYRILKATYNGDDAKDTKAKAQDLLNDIN